MPSARTRFISARYRVRLDARHVPALVLVLLAFCMQVAATGAGQAPSVKQDSLFAPPTHFQNTHTAAKGVTMRIADEQSRTPTPSYSASPQYEQPVTRQTTPRPTSTATPKTTSTPGTAGGNVWNDISPFAVRTASAQTPVTAPTPQSPNHFSEDEPPRFLPQMNEGAATPLNPSVASKNDPPTNTVAAGTANTSSHVVPTALNTTTLPAPSEKNPETKIPKSSSLALPPPTEAGLLHNDRNDKDPNTTSNPVGTLTTVLGSLGVVLGAFFLFVWVARRSGLKAVGPLANEVVEVLGHAPLAAKQRMHLVRIGGKLILLCVTPAGAETLTEITDPDEVERLVTLSQRNKPGSITHSFQQMLTEWGEEPAPKGFVGEEDKDTGPDTDTLSVSNQGAQ